MNTCIILVGCPGSGKSTYAQNKYPHYVRISQDDMGKKGHLEAFKQALNEKRTVVIDRMNFNKKQRSRYISKAREAGYKIEIIEFRVPVLLCLCRCENRVNHPTIKDNLTATNVIKFYFKNYKAPTADEYDNLKIIDL
jgi:predicted kinase